MSKFLWNCLGNKRPYGFKTPYHLHIFYWNGPECQDRHVTKLNSYVFYRKARNLILKICEDGKVPESLVCVCHFINIHFLAGILKFKTKQGDFSVTDFPHGNFLV